MKRYRIIISIHKKAIFFITSLKTLQVTTLNPGPSTRTTCYRLSIRSMRSLAKYNNISLERDRNTFCLKLPLSIECDRFIIKNVLYIFTVILCRYVIKKKKKNINGILLFFIIRKSTTIYMRIGPIPKRNRRTRTTVGKYLQIRFSLTYFIRNSSLILVNKKKIIKQIP